MAPRKTTANSANKKAVPPIGEIRQSQLLTTFGPGSMVDFPDHSVMILGLDSWRGHEHHPIYEPRLSQALRAISDGVDVALYKPPIQDDRPDRQHHGIKATVFPTWFVAQTEETYSIGNKIYQTRPLVSLNCIKSSQNHYIVEDQNGKAKKCKVVPVRFVQACPKGHISDIDWRRFIRAKSARSHCTCNYPNPQLYLDEGGTGNDFTDIFVRCGGCRARRPLSDATLPNSNALGHCDGSQPWLGLAARASEPCQMTGANGKLVSTPNRLLVRSASNAYFSQVLTVIALPEPENPLENALDRVYETFLKNVTDLEDIAFYRRKNPPVTEALAQFDDATVFAAIQKRQKSASPDSTDVAISNLKEPELQLFLAPNIADIQDDDFRAEILPICNASSDPVLQSFDRVLLIHKLREVTTLAGFTRFEAPIGDVTGDLSLDVRLAPLSREPHWFPASENSGEGIFLSFKPQTIQAWLQQPSVQKRTKILEKGHRQWCSRREFLGTQQPKFPGADYILLHSISHLLISAISLACGYSASAIRERIYSLPKIGYGILLYTGSPGSEGTLGGLIEVGRNIGHHLRSAIETSRLCSNDPICSQHLPTNSQSERFLHGAACHGCLLISEPSCENRNEYLDRALVARTINDPVDSSHAGFFDF